MGFLGGGVGGGGQKGARKFNNIVLYERVCTLYIYCFKSNVQMDNAGISVSSNSSITQFSGAPENWVYKAFHYYSLFIKYCG